MPKKRSVVEQYMPMTAGSSRFVCVIPARGGSKRVVRKNLVTFYGQPIISWSIKAALSSGLFSHVIVSTEDEEIAAAARKAGALTPFIRPRELADDFAATRQVLEHAAEWMRQHWPHEFAQIRGICCLYATAPFVTAEMLKGSCDRFVEGNFDSLWTVTDFGYPVVRALNEQDGLATFNWPDYETIRSQDCPSLFRDAGVLYWYRTASLLKAGSTEHRRGAYHIGRWEAIDIDTPEDLRIARYLFAMSSKGRRVIIRWGSMFAAALFLFGAGLILALFWSFPTTGSKAFELPGLRRESNDSSNSELREAQSLGRLNVLRGNGLT